MTSQIVFVRRVKSEEESDILRLLCRYRHITRKQQGLRLLPRERGTFFLCVCSTNHRRFGGIQTSDDKPNSYYHLFDVNRTQNYILILLLAVDIYVNNFRKTVFCDCGLD